MKLQKIISDKLSIVLFPAMFVLILAAGAVAEANVNQTSNPVVSDLQIPFEQTVQITTPGINGDTTEMVVFSGRIHLVVKYIPTDPILPPNPIRIHTNLMDVSGTGQITGGTYRATGAANLSFPAAAGSSFSVGTIYRLLPPNPIREGADLSLPIGYNISLNSDGYVSSAEAFYQPIEGF